MNAIIEKIREPWDIFRLIRLGFGGYILINSLLEGQYLLSIIGGLFLFQAISSTGCMGGACASIPAKKSSEEPAETVYEELGQKQSSRESSL